MIARSLLRLALCLGLCLGAGLVTGFVTYPEIPTWYADLAKPWWTPPNRVFPVVWNILYIMMAVSLWMLWDRTAPSPIRATAITLFFVQLALNAAWSPAFFLYHRPLAALFIIVLLSIVLSVTIYQSLSINRPAAWLLVPYLLWVLYASTLNGGIVALNP